MLVVCPERIEKGYLYLITVQFQQLNLLEHMLQLFPARLCDPPVPPPTHATTTFAAATPTQFETMRKSDQVREFRCFYHPDERKFYSVVMLGK